MDERLRRSRQRPRPPGQVPNRPRGRSARPDREPELESDPLPDPTYMSLPRDPDSEETLEHLTQVILAYWRQFHPDLPEPEPDDEPEDSPENVARSKAEMVVRFYRAYIVPFGKHQAWAHAMKEIVYNSP